MTPEFKERNSIHKERIQRGRKIIGSQKFFWRGQKQSKTQFFQRRGVTLSGNICLVVESVPINRRCNSNFTISRGNLQKFFYLFVSEFPEKMHEKLRETRCSGFLIFFLNPAVKLVDLSHSVTESHGTSRPYVMLD